MLQQKSKLSSTPLAGENLQKIIAHQFSSPVYISMLTCGTIALIICWSSLFSGGSVVDRLIALTQIPFLEQDALQPLVSALNISRGVQLVFLLCTTVSMAGFWMIFASAKCSDGLALYRIGFTAIEIVKFNLLVASLFVMPILAIQAYKLLNSIKSYADVMGIQEIISRISLLKVLVVIFALGTIGYLFDSLLTIMILKDSTCNTCANGSSSYYSPVFCFVSSVLLLYVQLKTEFSFVMLLICAGMILFGIFVIQYQNQMRHCT